jgi:hypothetical protein
VTPAAQVHAALEGSYRLVGFQPAGEASPKVARRHYLHAGPPLELELMSGPTRGALMAALMFEGEAQDAAEADRIIRAGDVVLTSAHAAGAVSPMACVITPGTPVAVVEHSSGLARFAPLNEGLGKAVRFGNFDQDTIANLRWMATTLAPVLHAALDRLGEFDVAGLLAEGLRRGDECHNRNVATTAQFVLALAPHIAEASGSLTDASAVLRHLSGNIQFSLSLSMATGKVMADLLHDLGPRGLVTAIAANGVELGIRVSGWTEWFSTPAPVQDATLLDGFQSSDMSPVTGDSPVVETIGLGASALSSAPSLALALGSDADGARRTVARMRSICVTESTRFLVAHDDLRGTPLGISVGAVVDSGHTPVFSTGYAHREPGRGRVGAGLLTVPQAPFDAAQASLTST